jgi:hypothetical protein
LAGGSAGLSTLSKGLEIQLSDFEAENAMLKGTYLQKVVEIVFGGVPNVLEICCMCWFMSLGRILLQGSVSTNQFDPGRPQLDHGNVEVVI